jgi:hypothetical protein
MKVPLHKELAKLPLQTMLLFKYGMDITECPCCKNKTLQLLQVYYPWKRADDG